MATRIEKLTAIAEAKKLDAFLLTSAASVKYFSGYFFYFEYGASPFQLLPSALFVVPGKSSYLIIADNETAPVNESMEAITAVPYASYVYEKPSDFAHQFLNQLFQQVNQLGGVNKRIGIEPNTLPFTVADALSRQFSHLEFIDISADVEGLRTIKDKDEIEMIRSACKLCDIGQAAVVKHAKQGITELELFAEVRREIDAAAGIRVPLMADLVSGSSTASGGGMPANKIIQAGDIILSDLTPCLNGYWGDSCNTIILGEGSAGKKQNYQLVKEALAIGIDAIRPGVQANEIDRLMREHIGSFPHHGGHGVGIVYHEEPRIVPYNTMLLQAGMVIALEPAIYKSDYGIRLEHLVAVTETGCEVLTQFQHAFQGLS